MPGKRITDLTALSGAGSANNDDLVIFDATASETKRISRSQLAEGMQGDVQVFSNKTINLGSNTLTGTTAQFNTALSDNNFATQAGSEVLTNKTIDSANNTLTVNYKEARVETSDASRTHLFTTVAALLADTGTYTTYAAGQIVEAGGFRYQVAASGASDHHLTTAGGVKLYALPDASGNFAVEQFGAVGDGVTDDNAAIQNAIYKTGFAPLVFRGAKYRSNDALYSYNGKALIGVNSNSTVIEFNADATTDGLVLGWRNVTAYANEAAFLAALAGLDDGWYLIGSTDLRFVRNGAQAGTATRTIAPVASSNIGHRIRDIRLSGASTSAVRDLLVADNVWKLDLDNVWAFTAGGRGFVITQVLHCSTRGLRSDNTVSHGVDLTGGDTTSTVMIGGYHRTTHSGAGIKSDCIGLSLVAPIIEGIGGGSGSDVYAPGIWITGGTATIEQPYFEDVRGHNIFCSDGVTTIVGGNYIAGEGALNARYAALVVTGTAKVTVAGAAFAPGGGNKSDIFVSRDATTNNVWLSGAGPAEIVVLANNISNPLNYTEANYDVADTTALAALVGMTLNQTAHVRSDTGAKVRNYVYDGSAWVKVSSHEFNGGYITRNPNDGTWRTFGQQMGLRAGNSLSAISFLRSVSFDAGAAFDNVAGMVSGAAVGAHTAVTATKTLGFTIPGYSGAQAKNYQARFNTPLLPAGIVCQVNILGATSVQIVVLNTTAASINLNSDIRGQIVIERWVQDID